jgi:glycosyltransferase involved in cell wall biosynthesis
VRIALVSQEYPPETALGGIGSQTHVKAHGLAALGHDVYVISHSLDHDTHTTRDGDVNVIRIPGRDAVLPIYADAARWISYSVEVAAAIARLHAEHPLDLIDFPEWAAEGYVHLVNRTAWNWIPTVIHIHGPLVMFAHEIGWPEKDSEFYRVGTMLEGTCLRLADAVFSSSDCSADWCARHYGLKRASIPTLHSGIDTGLFRRHEVTRDERPTIIFVGKIERNKGVTLLLDAAIRLRQVFPNLRLRIVGRGDAELVAELQSKAMASGADDLIEFCGFVERQELPLYLSSAEVFVAPSTYEGGPGFVYLEAMSCGVPVIACAGSGSSEVVKHGETGLLVPPNDHEALTSAIAQLLSNREEARAMGVRGRRYVELHADSKRCLQRLENFYAAVVATGGLKAAAATA